LRKTPKMKEAQVLLEEKIIFNLDSFIYLYVAVECKFYSYLKITIKFGLYSGVLVKILKKNSNKKTKASAQRKLLHFFLFLNIKTYKFQFFHLK
jgi:hypothetical protein